MNHSPGEFVPIARLAREAPSEYAGELPIDEEHRFHAAIDLIRRRKLFILVFVLVGTLLTSVAAFVVAPVYIATAQFIFEPTQAQVAAGALDPVVDTHIATIISDARIREALKALPALPEYRAALERASTEATKPGFEREIRAWLAWGAESIRDAILPTSTSQGATDEVPLAVPSLEKAKESLLVRQERRSNVISVSYKDTDPDRAAIIANEFVQSHVDHLTERKRLQAEGLRTWLEQRLAQALVQSEAADDALRAHISAHGTPSADGAVGEQTAEIARQLELVRAEVARLERRRDGVRASLQSAASHVSNEEALRERSLGDERAGAFAAPVAAPRQAGIDPPVPPQTPNVSHGDARDQLKRLEHEAEIFRGQARSLAERMTSLRAASAAILAQWQERQALERRATSAAEIVRGVLREQQESKGQISTGVQVLARASPPVRPTSPSPYLYIPAAIIAFAALGGMAASVRERMDRTFRSERELAAVLRVGCIGLVPEPPRRGLGALGRFRSRRPAYDRASDAIATLALDLIQKRGDGKTLAITSSHDDEAKTALATTIATYAAKMQRRVLLVSADLRRSARAAAPEWNASTEDGQKQQLPFRIRRDTNLGFDHLVLAEAGAPHDLSFITRGGFLTGQGTARDCYDCIIIDAPTVFESADVSVLAPKVDGVLFAVRWGSTRREVAVNALDYLRKPSVLCGDVPPNIFAVLTRVNLRAHARYRHGDAGEFLWKHRGRRRAQAPALT
jgi:succinoglycan biosynthesis transport protein ExoP